MKAPDYSMTIEKWRELIPILAEHPHGAELAKDIRNELDDTDFRGLDESKHEWAWMQSTTPEQDKVFSTALKKVK